MSETAQRPYSVAELTREIKFMLEGAYPSVYIEGEISNFKAASSGHWYFTLKDDSSTIQAVMFRGSQRGIPGVPEDGQMVRVRGSVSVYPQRGNYQVICASMEFGGEGRILQMLEERKRRLAQEGLFDQERKRPLPRFPRRVAVLSAETGAAVRDIIRVLRRRAPWLHVVVVNIPVQGSGAAEKIVTALERVQRMDLGEVIILGRGGGSLEDLLAFSDEALVRAVADCSIPCISAVGHEIDWALSDFAADLRAPTPSAAAEMLCAGAEELQRRVMAAGKTVVHGYLNAKTRLELAIKPFRREMLEDSFLRYLRPRQQRVDELSEALAHSLERYITGKRQLLEMSRRELAACDPMAVVKRGYAVIRNQQGDILVQSKQATESGDVRIQFRDGSVAASVHSNTEEQL